MWRNVLLVSATAFVVTTAFVSLAGVPRWEMAAYTTIIQYVGEASGGFSWLSRLGSKSVLYPVGLLLLFALPTPLLRRWWLWVAVLVAASFLEDWVKGAVDRPRPQSMRAGFPSAHTTTAAVFFSLAAYLIGKILWTTLGRRLVWGLAGGAIFLVALARIAVRAHWPLDTIAGATLGLLCCAAAVWWHETHAPVHSLLAGRRWAALRAWIHRWREVLPLPLFAVLLLTPPMDVVERHLALDLAFDILGVLVVGAGLALRAWAAGSFRGLVADDAGRPRLVITGPYQCVRHPVYIANLLIALGIVIMSENALGLIIIPAAFFGGYRLIVRSEEENLQRLLGATYERYCQEVPRWVARRFPIPVASPRRSAWLALRTESRALVTTGMMAIIAELSESMPHLLR